MEKEKKSTIILGDSRRTKGEKGGKESRVTKPVKS